MGRTIPKRQASWVNGRKRSGKRRTERWRRPPRVFLGTKNGEFPANPALPLTIPYITVAEYAAMSGRIQLQSAGSGGA